MAKESLSEMLLFQLVSGRQSEPNVVQCMDLFVHIGHGEILQD